jgi:peptidoglycan/xylan/chitin deacetylase (PgdA/CDA1 family)
MHTLPRTVSFCFDDGFRASAETARRIFEARKLSAAFCVLAAPELTEDAFIRGARLGDWGFWRETSAAGHDVAAHGFAHEHLGRMPFEQACDSVSRTLEIFTQELPGFDALQSIYHVAYVRAPENVVRWISERSLGVRLATGGFGVNAWNKLTRGGCVDCMTWGPDSSDGPARAHVERFLEAQADWLVLVFHGLDREGWGPLSSHALEGMLDRLLAAGVAVESPNRVLARRIAKEI